MCLGAGNAGANRAAAGTDALSSPDGRGSLVENFDRLSSGADECLDGRTQQLVLSREGAGAWIPDVGLKDDCAILGRRETQHPVLLNQ